MIDLATLPPELREEAAVLLATDPTFSEWASQLESAAFYNFRPRPDDPANFDQQTGYVEAKDAVSFLLGGNASGKTACSALKCARFLLSQPPPRPDTPFWVVAQTYEQVGAVCWKEKLCDLGFLPRTEVEWDRISWRNAARGEPASVPLKPWPLDRPGARAGCNWRLEFKSVEQGRAAMQARSIGGFWFSEQFPLNIFLEILRGCRDYFYPGGQFCEFTPIDPDLCLWVEELMDKPKQGVNFYRCNTESNRQVLDAQAPGFFEQFFGAVPDEMMATRMTGALASFEGVIYQAFNTSVHVLDPGDELMQIPPGAQHFMGTDWGASAEHPHATHLGCRDGMGDWRIYDEYWNSDQGLITLDHADKIIEMADSWHWPTTLRRERKTGNERLVLAGDDPLYGYNFADPSRPGEINEFNYHGIPTAPANNQVFQGIDTIRTLLKVQPPKQRPKLFVSRKCKHLIDEMRKYRWLKGKRSTTGHSVLNPAVARPSPLKRDDDCCFPAGTLVETPYGERRIEQLREGDTVFSHLGATVVRQAGSVRTANLCRLMIKDSCDIICTPDHSFRTFDGRWVQAMDLTGEQVTQCRFIGTKTETGILSSGANTVAKSGADTQNLAESRITLGDASAAVVLKPRYVRTYFTSRFGKTITAPSRLALWFTTGTKTRPITRLQTLNFSRSRSTPRGTALTFSRLSKPPARGIARPLERSGTPNTGAKVGRVASGGGSSAPIVAIPSKLATRARIRGFAPQSAGTTRALRREETTSVVRAPSAVALSRLTATQKRSIAPSNAAPRLVGEVERLAQRETVYCLTTDAGSFLVQGGIVASNCDDLRYMIHSAEKQRGAGITSTTQSPEGIRRKSVALDVGEVSKEAQRAIGKKYRPGWFRPQA